MKVGMNMEAVLRKRDAICEALSGPDGIPVAQATERANNIAQAAMCLEGDESIDDVIREALRSPIRHERAKSLGYVVPQDVFARAVLAWNKG